MNNSNFFTKNSFKFKLGALLAAGFFIFANTAVAIGQLTEPIVVNNALRGYEFEETLTVINTEDMNAKIFFNTEGEIEGWAVFYDPADPENMIESILMPARTTKEIIAHFKVPDDTANGEYTGLANAEIKPGDDAMSSDTSVNLRQSIGRQVKITVTDQEEINLEVAVIPLEYDLPAGKPLEVKIIYYNTGNVVVKPDIGIRVFQNINDEDVVYYNVIQPYPENMDGARPQEEHEIPLLSIPVDARVKTGNVRAKFTFFVKDEEIYTETIKFSTGLVEDYRSNLVEKESAKLALKRNYLLIGGLFAIMAILAAGIFWILRKKGKFQKNRPEEAMEAPSNIKKTMTNGLKRVKNNSGKEKKPLTGAKNSNGSKKK